ncbi:MAG: Clp protease N-terminal domain-containing protein, partial [Armatimonadota bacterium]
MDFQKFTNQAKEVISHAHQLLGRYSHQQLDVEHILLSLLEQDEGVVPRVLQKLSIDRDTLTKKVERELGGRPQVSGAGAGEQIFITPHTQRVLDFAFDISDRFGDKLVASEHIFLAIMEDGQTEAAEILNSVGVTADKTLEALQGIRGAHQVTDESAEAGYEALERYSRDLTELAAEGKLDPVIGRDDEIKRVIQVLSRRTKNNPVLIGEPGVGKTAITHGLAQR